MSISFLGACVTLLVAGFSSLLYKSRSSSAGQSSQTRPQGYLLHNQVTHARLLPREAAHAFTYPTLALLVSLDALESRKLDLCRGWVFGYGGLWGRITGLRSEPYLTQEVGSIRGKLEGILRRNGFEAWKLQDAWMLTMPSFLGLEGINPLTVYFCYGSEDTLWLTVLEIHNTFGESHVHILELGRGEDEPPAGFDHQWTFPRQFHVSPFNDRSGFYTVSIKSPSHSPMLSTESPEIPPRPAVRVHQYTASEHDPTIPGVLKLTALLRPTHATRLTARSLLLALAQSPFALLLTFFRILYVAWILHYVKRLDVYLRPDPLPSTDGWDASASGKPASAPASLGVKWLDEGILERFARLRIEAFLRTRSYETHTQVTLISAEPYVKKLVFKADVTVARQELTVWYTSSKFFSMLFLCPSAAHALLAGCDAEKIFRVSSREIFLDVFSSSATPRNGMSVLQCLRSRQIPKTLSIPIPSTHYADSRAWATTLSSTMVIGTSQMLDRIEHSIFVLVRARVVAGQEPWKMWDRADARMKGESVESSGGGGMGSTIRKRE